LSPRLGEFNDVTPPIPLRMLKPMESNAVKVLFGKFFLPSTEVAEAVALRGHSKKPNPRAKPGMFAPPFPLPVGVEVALAEVKTN